MALFVYNQSEPRVESGRDGSAHVLTILSQFVRLLLRGGFIDRAQFVVCLRAGNWITRVVAGEAVLRAKDYLEAAVAVSTVQSRATNFCRVKKLPENSPGARRGGGGAMLR